MPIYGVRATDELLKHAATMEGLGTEAVELPGAEVLQVMFEIDDRSLQSLLPPALHPTIPPSVTFIFWRCSEGPFGSFQMAQVRAGCRAGVRPRGLPLATWCDSEQAAEALRRRWGFNCRPGEVQLNRNYDRIAGTVMESGDTVLRASLIDPQAISGADVQYVANMNLAWVPRDGGPQPRLVQVDPEYTMHRADRGRPVVDELVTDRTTDGVLPVYPVSASCTVCDITLPQIRYIVDPEVPALQGTETVRH